MSSMNEGASTAVVKDEDHHTADLTLSDEEIVARITNDAEACKKNSRSGGIKFRFI